VRWQRSERISDVWHAGAYLAAGLVLLWTVPEVAVHWDADAADPPVWTSAVMIVVASAGVPQRRRRPTVALAVACAVLLSGVLVTGLTPMGALLVFADALYCTVRFAPRRVSGAVAGASGVAIVLPALADLVSEGGRAALLTALNLTLVLAVPVLWGREVRRQAEYAEIEHARAEQTRRMAELDRAAAVASERARMARDLHDVVAGQLSAIAIQSEAALNLPGCDPATLRRVLAAVRRDSVASLAEMRTLIGLLRADGSAGTEPRTAPAGLDRLDALVRASRSTGVQINLEDGRPRGGPAPSAAVDLAAYRIVQESLTNAVKHAPGASVRLHLYHRRGALVIDVENDLVPGTRRGDGTGTGLLGLRERAAAVNGTVEAGPRGSTWRVRATLPVPASEGSPR
jgi:signal transduction histidine kinase